jgi:predicted RNA-binding protein with PIN domain
MRYVLDACNLIFQDRELDEMVDRRGFEATREALAQRLSRFAHAERVAEVIAVFDASGPHAGLPATQEHGAGRVRMVFARRGEKADEAIHEFIAAQRSRKEYVVVTNDKFVIRQTRGSGARHMSCGDFLRRLRAAGRRRGRDREDPRKFAGLAEHEVEKWMKVFGFDDR